VALRHGLIFGVAMRGRRFRKVALALFRAQPIEAVAALGYLPAVSQGRWSWYQGNADLPPMPDMSRLPAYIFYRLPGPTVAGRQDLPRKDYPTAEACHEALSAACVSYGRALVGLPPL
jgi:hypothetical protein